MNASTRFLLAVPLVGCHDRIVLLDRPVNHPNKLGEANPVIGSTLTG